MDEQLKLKKNTTDTPKLEPVQGTAPPLSITLNFVTLKSFILNHATGFVALNYVHGLGRK